MQQPRLKTPTRNSPVKPPSDPIQRAWIALGRGAPVIRDRVDNELKAAGLPDLSWYTVLWELERADAPTRPRDLAIPLFIERYQLSRLVDRMEAERLITRRECPEDQRGHLLDLTPKGRALRLKMWAVYAPAMDAAMDRLNDAEALKLAELLYKLTGMAPPF
jgi:DNA-binding MarR family transcriptional regulator